MHVGFFQVSSPAVLVRKTVCNRLINLAYYCGVEKRLSKIGESWKARAFSRLVAFFHGRKQVGVYRLQTRLAFDKAKKSQRRRRRIAYADRFTPDFGRQWPD